MKNTYISLDIETTGERVGIDSILSIGACVIGRREDQFYTELKPLHLFEHLPRYQIEAIKVGCSGLRCLKAYDPDNKFNPMSTRFDPDAVLKEMEKRGQPYIGAMCDLASWVNKVSRDTAPVMVTDIQPYDGAFVMMYYSVASLKSTNPFGYKGKSLTEWYQGILRDPSANLRQLGIKDTRSPPHNALEDALFQAKLAEAIFELMGEKNPL